ncbi:MAG: hypothetical protein IT375_14990 [Polyangiaceae bacterium]|mgnify:CR=1 FL=1|nr:hypothetical protein [Polyangiaceae bacterium]MCK6535476.1 hypothetical protein [Polyangiaceae bacterium]
MRHLKISALLVASSVMTLAAVGNSEETKFARVKLSDFVRESNTLVGAVPGTEINPGYFKRLENTTHLPGIGGPNYPPNPCNAHISVYNKIITKVPEGPGRLNATLSVLTNLARSSCCVDTQWTGDATSEASVLQLRPVACDL